LRWCISLEFGNPSGQGLTNHKVKYLAELTSKHALS
jgi:hypothetical protein